MIQLDLQYKMGNDNKIKVERKETITVNTKSVKTFIDEKRILCFFYDEK